MRYLTRQFAIGALRRGRGIEQFLGSTELDGVPAVRWVAISHHSVSPHTVQDPDDDQSRDLPQFISLDPVDEDYVGQGGELGRAADEAEAMSLAEQLVDATPDRWVNVGVAGDEYQDLVQARRGDAPAGA